MPTRLSSIRQIAMTVSDVASALGFYRDVLGLEFLFSAGENLAFLAAGDIRVMLTTPKGAGAPGANSTLYFSVDDVQRAYDDLLARGARAERGPAMTARMPDHQLWTALLRDPDGHLVGLMEERR